MYTIICDCCRHVVEKKSCKEKNVVVYEKSYFSEKVHKSIKTKYTCKMCQGRWKTKVDKTSRHNI